jgi:hypothetical protein
MQLKLFAFDFNSQSMLRKSKRGLLNLRPGRTTANAPTDRTIKKLVRRFEQKALSSQLHCSGSPLCRAS